ncbi:short chain dehydrogenase [Moniliophthora roreri MCA 2997]|uniref:Short chain dehydrogenase n=2 Tax=Moniliophthora roreri TaxID=221103 RepID=V2Y5R3_MONRO|nr:short chain dehydrogenase [Moniliophthora roreri MCA 2997]
MAPLVWLITGTSSGFGKRLVTAALNRGDCVIATARSVLSISTPGFFPGSNSENLKTLELDVTWPLETIQNTIDTATQLFGRIDVLVNNAGYALKMLVEDCSARDFMTQFEANFFGIINVTNAVLPQMRERNQGTVVMIASRSSWKPEIPTTALYSSSKAALRVYSETLSAEISQFSIRVLIVEPGAFRTEGIVSASPYNPTGSIPEYNAIRQRIHSYFTEQVEGKQRGDPEKAVQLIVDVVKGEGSAAGRSWPLYLPLGADAVEAVKEKCERMMSVVDEWRDLTSNLDFDTPLEYKID